jgi:hypothetical protein
VRHLSLPFGRGDQRVYRIAQEAGYASVSILGSSHLSYENPPPPSALCPLPSPSFPVAGFIFGFDAQFSTARRSAAHIKMAILAAARHQHVCHGHSNDEKR